jgi:hypothetical protein
VAPTEPLNIFLPYYKQDAPSEHQLDLFCFLLTLFLQRITLQHNDHTTQIKPPFRFDCTFAPQEHPVYRMPPVNLLMKFIGIVMGGSYGAFEYFFTLL